MFEDFLYPLVTPLYLQITGRSCQLSTSKVAASSTAFGDTLVIACNFDDIVIMSIQLLWHSSWLQMPPLPNRW